MKIKEAFESFRDRPWLFVRPLGNWGDELIFAGAEHLADSIGIDWHSIEPHEFPDTTTSPDHCIYLHGGGGYNNWCSGKAFDNLEIAVNRPAQLVVQGPISTEVFSDWLAARMAGVLKHIECRELLFFARENVTHDTLARLGQVTNGATLCTDHDTAFALSESDILKLAELDGMPGGKYDLIVVREDPEQPVQPEARGGAKKATSGSRVVLDPAYIANSFRHWLRIHLYARSVTSNRLHSAILGAIIGKQVTLGPGSYHKNRSVWEYSLANRGVAWADSLGHSRSRLWSRLPPRAQDSYSANCGWLSSAYR